MSKFFIGIQTMSNDQSNRKPTLAEAELHAAQLLADNPKFQSITICEAVALVERTSPPTKTTKIE